MRAPLFLVATAAFLTASFAAADPGPIPLSLALPELPIIRAAGTSCKTVSTCEEAVRLWCGGYSRADADKDGIPCENVCHSLKQVQEIRERIGC